jgi:hypothetical protein
MAEKQWLTSQAGKEIVGDRVAKRIVQAAERVLRAIEYDRKAMQYGLLSEGVFREIYGDVQTKEAEARALIARCEAYLARSADN